MAIDDYEMFPVVSIKKNGLTEGAGINGLNQNG
jgi:hypothetical protein